MTDDRDSERGPDVQPPTPLSGREARSSWECPACGFRRAVKDENPGPGVLARGAVHLTVGTVIDGHRVRAENPGDLCRAWPSLEAYKIWLENERRAGA